MANISIIPVAGAPQADMPQAPRANPHFERFGGHAAVVRLVDAFYQAMDARADARTIRAMHDDDLRATRGVLVRYLSEWMGGPPTYTTERGAPKLRRRHQHFAIDPAARDAWMACMRAALADTCPDATLRAELEDAFAKVADFIRNTEPGGHTRPHPGRPREVQPDSPGAPHTSLPTRSTP